MWMCVSVCRNVVADSTQMYLLAFTIFSHLVYRYLFARALLFWCMCVCVCRCCLFYSCCVSTIHIIHHNITEKMKKKKKFRVFVHIGIIRQFHFGRCLMFFFLVFRSFFSGSVFIFIIPLLWRYSCAVGFRSSSILRNGQTMVAM